MSKKRLAWWRNKRCTSKRPRTCKEIATNGTNKKKLGKISIENAPRAYEPGVKGVKNKKHKKILQSDFSNSVWDVGRTHAYDKLG